MSASDILLILGGVGTLATVIGGVVIQIINASHQTKATAAVHADVKAIAAAVDAPPAPPPPAA